jgi:DNA-binding NtrC family response regulator
MNPVHESDQPVRLVVIDDDPKNLKMVKFTLSSGELEIHTASDPRVGLDLIAQLHPQIVLIDLVLPGIGGMELLQQIVQLEQGIAVILMTGHNSPELATEAIKMGAIDYFPKPFSPQKLRERIDLIVEDKKRRQRSSTMGGIAEKQREALREI